MPFHSLKRSNLFSAFAQADHVRYHPQPLTKTPEWLRWAHILALIRSMFVFLRHTGSNAHNRPALPIRRRFTASSFKAVQREVSGRCRDRFTGVARNGIKFRAVPVTDDAWLTIVPAANSLQAQAEGIFFR